jgi:ribosome recycling factor
VLLLFYPHAHASRLTIEAQLAAYSTASKQAEEVRVQIRRQHQSSVKKGKYPRHSMAHDEVRVCVIPRISVAPKCNACVYQFQALQDRHIADVDAILAQIKKSSGAR